MCYLKHGNTGLNQKLNEVLAKINSAGENEVSPPKLNNGTRSDKTSCIAADSSSDIELHGIKDQEVGDLISFVANSLSIALENPHIHDKVKSSVDSVVKKYWEELW